MPFQKGQSGNPKGKPKGAVSACTKAKADYFKVYQRLGGYKGFLKYMKDNKQLWPDFFFKVLPSLMPKKNDLEGNVTGILTIRIKGKQDDDSQPPRSNPARGN